MEHWRPASPSPSKPMHLRGHLSPSVSGAGIDMGDPSLPTLTCLGAQYLAIADGDDKSPVSTAVHHMYNFDPVFKLPSRKNSSQPHGQPITTSDRQDVTFVANAQKLRETHGHALDTTSPNLKPSLEHHASWDWHGLADLEEYLGELQSPQKLTKEFWENLLLAPRDLTDDERPPAPSPRVEGGKRARRAFRTTARYHCNFESCDMWFPTNSALERHYQRTHEERTLTEGNSRNSEVASLTITGPEDMDSTLTSLAIRTDDHLPIRLSGVANHYNGAETLASASSEKRRSVGPKSVGGSEAKNAPKQRILLDTPVIRTSLAELVSATPELSQHKLIPSLITQAELPHDAQAGDRSSATSWTPLDPHYDSASVTSVSSLTGFGYLTEHGCSSMDGIELVSNNTGLSAMNQPAGEDAPPKQGNGPLNSATCGIYENHRPVCGIGLKYPVLNASDCHETRQLNRINYPSASVPLYATNNLATNPMPDMEIQTTCPPNIESRDSRTDQDIDKHDHEMCSVNTSPITSQPHNPVIGRTHGSMVSKALPDLPDLFTNTQPDKRRINAQSSPPSFSSRCPVRRLLPKPTRRQSRLVAAVVKRLAVLRAPEDCDPLTLMFFPELSVVRPSAARARQQKFRRILVLALLHYHSFSWEHTGSSFTSGYNHTSGSGQTPGSINSRSAGGNRIWSGQGPGSELFSLQQLEETLSSRHIPDVHGPRLNTYVSKLTHDPITSSIPQHLDYAPPLPIPLEILSHSYFAGFSEGVSSVYAALTHLRNNTIQPQISQMSSTQDGVSIRSDLSLLTATERRKTTPLAGLDGRVQTAYLTSVDPESLPNTNLHSNDGLPTAGMAFDPEHQVPTPGADHSPRSHPSGPSVMPNPEIGSSDCSSNPPIPNHNFSSNGCINTFAPAFQAQPPRLSQEPTTGYRIPSISEISLGRGGNKPSRHRCDSCARSFRRPHLLEDHKRIHTGEETSIYRCKFRGCTRVYTSQSNMTRHFKSHFRANQPQSTLPMSAERMPAGILAQPPASGLLIHITRGPSAHQADHGTPGSGDIRFRPYETPDTVRRKFVKRQM